MSKTIIFFANTSWFLYNFRKKTIFRFKEQGYRVVCLGTQDGFDEKLRDDLGVEAISISLDGQGKKTTTELRSIFDTYRIIRKISPDLVFNSTIKCCIYGALSCIILKKSYVNHVSGLGTAFIHRSLFNKIVFLIFKRCNEKAQTVFFENSDDCAAFYDDGHRTAGKAKILPGSGIDLKHFDFEDLPREKRVTFVMIARLIGDKGVREYVSACRKLNSAGYIARCLLLGPHGISNVSAISRAEIEQWHHDGDIEYLGEASDVRPYIRQSHVLVLPSYREAMGRVILEAAAMGRPAIVTDAPGCRHAVVSGETGWYCQVRDSETLFQRMMECVKMEHRELQKTGVNARRRMEQYFPESLVTDAHVVELEKSLLSSGARA